MLALREGHQRITSEHLAKVLLDDEQGLCRQLANQAAAHKAAGQQLQTYIQEALDKQSKVTGSGAGQVYLDPEVAQALALKKMSSSPNPQFDSLSTRELTIMLMVVNGMKVEEISERLYLSSKTVHTYRHNIFKKLNLKNDVELAVFALKHGFLEEQEIS